MSKDTFINPANKPATYIPLEEIKDDPLLAPDSYANQAKGKTGLVRLIKATGYSIDGFRAAYKFEAAFRQVVWLNFILFAVIIMIPFDASIKMMLVSVSFLSLIVELFNTGIEASVDHTSTDQHPLAKIAKDVGSAAQFLALLLILVLWSMALLDFL
ncbi:MAG: diacylglycerol kinase [Psychrobacter sp.]|nr:diacylglycerol kinase [Psychrobacter sp.]